MNNEETTVVETPTSKTIDINKIDALCKHMLLTVESFCELLGVSRVSYYNWLKGKPMRRATVDKVRRVVRKLVVCVSQHDWPNGAVFVADQPTRLKMLQELLVTLDKEPQQS